MNNTGFQYYKAYQDVQLIVNKYRDWTDPLSKSLCRWEMEGVMMSLSFINSPFISEEERENLILQNIRNLMHKLRSEILMAHVNLTPLHTPVLTGRMTVFNFNKGEFVEVSLPLTWNMDTLTAYMECLELDQQEGYDHIYKGRQTIEIKAHDFAIDMLRWMNNVGVHETEQARATSSNEERVAMGKSLNEVLTSNDKSPSTVSLLLQLSSYGILSAIFAEKSGEKVREHQEQSKKLAEEREQKEAEIEREKAEEKKRKEDHQTKMEADLKELEKMQEEDAERIRKRAEDLRTKTKEAESKTEQATAESKRLEEENIRIQQESAQRAREQAEANRREVEAWAEKRRKDAYGGGVVGNTVSYIVSGGGGGGGCLIL